MTLEEGETARPAFSVAIPTYRRGKTLLRTLEDVFAQKPAPAEVIVVDQTDTHEPHVLEQLGFWEAAGRIRWMRLAEPNLPLARNRALETAKTPVLIFVDDDVRLSPGFCAAHLRHYENGATDAVSGRVRQRDFWTPFRKKVEESAADYYLNFDYSSPQSRPRVARLSGCNHSLRVESARAAGGYDGRFIGSAVYEDADLGLRLWRRGGTIVYEAEAVLEHLLEEQGGCRAERDEKQRSAEVVFLTLYFLFKHFYPGRHFWSQFLFRYPRRFLFNLDHLRRPWLLPRMAWTYLASSCRAWKLRRHPHYLDTGSAE